MLAKGSVADPERRSLVEKICAVYPNAEIIDAPDTPHNAVDLSENDMLARHYKGKRTLVFGEHKGAVRFSDEAGNVCPNYWHFSPYGFCAYDCKYCYLAGTMGVKWSPTVKIFVNLAEMMNAINRRAMSRKRQTAFYMGKLQDPMALDPLTGYSRLLVPFFARHPYAQMTLLTKSADVDNLLDLDHRGRTHLSWSLNPPEICAEFEENVPSLDERIEAMKRCAAAGYPVRGIVMPVIPIEGWRDAYARFLQRLLKEIPLVRLTFGGICIYQGAKQLMERKMGRDNAVSVHLEPTRRGDGDGRRRYGHDLRTEMYSFLADQARAVRPDLDLALCLEEQDVWRATHTIQNLGLCNCLL
ncbi:MAG: hypothetical protein M5R36_25245 [Deltaproteobacteria bacterium]|nr:hypothetical protein [Deltaproteobacteria bacterium]